ncbi:MAG: hypothetical protein HY866_00635, partial [Chloroflexi bacterium]|nr:hypothetical protein [Chloroflexota bacterium]
YVRNLALGHEAVTFPATYWHSFAQRSGQELGWPLLIAALVAGGLAVSRQLSAFSKNKSDAHPPAPSPLGQERAVGAGLTLPDQASLESGLTPYPLSIQNGEGTIAGDSPLSLRSGERGQGIGVKKQGAASSAPTQNRMVRFLPLLALILMIAGALPTAIRWEALESADDVWRWVRGDFPAGQRLGARDWTLILGGVGLLVGRGRGAWRSLDLRRREMILLLWALLLPYAVVWFRDFSYHYRLSFAIVPLVGVQIAALIDGWLWDWLAARRRGRVLGGALIGGVIAVAVAASVQHSADAWLNDDLPNDTVKYDRGNPALMVVVHALERYAEELGRPPVVAIPGEDRLPFFFPTWEIRNSREIDDLPVRLEDLQGVDIFVNSSPGLFLMQWAGVLPNSLQAEAAVTMAYHTLDVHDWDGAPWPTVLAPIPLSPDGSLPVDDGNFRYTMFTLNPAARTAPMAPNGLREDTVIFGDFAQFVGYAVVSLDWYGGADMTLLLYWRPTDQSPPAYDYSIYVHLLDANGEMIAHWDGQPLQSAYPTRFWRPGESLLDYWVLPIPEGLPLGPAHLRIGIYDPISDERLPVTIDGEPAGDGLTLPPQFEIK